MDNTFGTQTTRCIYRSGSLKTVARQVTKYTLCAVRVQKVKRESNGRESVGDCAFVYGNAKENHE
jgi:hypothetical protein